MSRRQGLPSLQAGEEEEGLQPDGQLERRLGMEGST